MICRSLFVLWYFGHGHCYYPLWNLEISRTLKTTFHDFKGFDINSDQEFTPVKFSPIALVSLDKVRIHMRKPYWQLSIKDMMYEHVEKYYIKERNRICHIFRKVIVIALFNTIFMVPMTISLKEGSYWTKCSYWLNWSHHFEILRNICVTNDHVYVPLVIITFTSFPHSWLITGFIARVIRRVPIMEHWLPAILEHDACQ
jgi:hypothetical protein